MDKPIPMSLKIGRNTYEIKKGDFIYYNTSCYQFFTGDGRIIRSEKFATFNHIILTKSALKAIPLDKLIKKEAGGYIKWYF